MRIDALTDQALADCNVMLICPDPIASYALRYSVLTVRGPIRSSERSICSVCSSLLRGLIDSSPIADRIHQNRSRSRRWTTSTPSCRQTRGRVAGSP